MPPEIPLAGRVRVFDAASSSLLAVGEAGAPRDSSQRFSCQQGNAALLAHYFGRGKREARVQYGRNEGLLAHISTRWEDGRRVWTLDW